MDETTGNQSMQVEYGAALVLPRGDFSLEGMQLVADMGQTGPVFGRPFRPRDANHALSHLPGRAAGLPSQAGPRLSVEDIAMWLAGGRPLQKTAKAIDAQ